MHLAQQSGKKFGIFGLGITGHSLYRSLKTVALDVICFDDSSANLDKFTAIFGNESIVSISNHNWRSLDKIVISPGVPKSHPIFALAFEYNIDITSDIELFMEENTNSELILITGTNGKSTTTALIGHILQSNKLDYHVGGNIGVPVLALPMNAKGYVFEVSSFQLDLLRKINPNIAVLLNITPDHLDRHHTLEEYIRVKEKILANDAVKIIGIDNSITNEIYEKYKYSDSNKVIAISGESKRQHPNSISCNGTNIVDKFFDNITYSYPETQHLSGTHNFANLAASFAVSRALGLSGDEIIKSIKTYKALKHRMQYICTSNNVSFYNDSKATNTSSTAAALASFDNIFWLAGGIFKEKDFSLLDKYIINVKKAYLFGRDRELFVSYLKDKTKYELVETIEEAFCLAMIDVKKAEPNSVILLSPACASYDQFKNFEHRGDVFEKLVLEAVRYC